jgi:hypothetical protein
MDEYYFAIEELHLLGFNALQSVEIKKHVSALYIEEEGKQGTGVKEVPRRAGSMLDLCFVSLLHIG